MKKEKKERTLISYPFLLDDGSVARLYLPTDLTPNEAKRISQAVGALASIKREDTK